MSIKEYAPALTEAFGERMQGILNDAALALMTSIGHQVGLFDTLARRPAMTSPQIAQAAGLHERYVREWLAAMVCGRVILFDPVARTYTLPPEHAAWLTRAAGARNLAGDTQVFALLAQVEPALIACFRNGGGVPYSAYPRFQQIMAENSRRLFDTALLSDILPVVPGLIERLQTGIDALDAGCGSGRAVNLMAQAFPNSRFTGYDLSEEAIAAAWDEAAALRLKNVVFEALDITQITAMARYDLITAFDSIHDQAQPAQVLQHVARALRPGGTFLMVDIRASSDLAENMELPLAPFMYTISCMHCMTVSLAADGAGLGAMWGQQLACRMLAEAGFTNVTVARIEADTGNSYYIAMK
jgi:SAM-dependent methyltransferase